MKATIFLIALAVAGLLEREGYSNFAWFMVAIAFLEGIVEPWWRARKRRVRRKQRERRERDGVTKEDVANMEPSAKRAWYRIYYGSTEK